MITVPEKRGRCVSWRMLFLLVVGGAYAIVYLLHPDVASASARLFVETAGRLLPVLGVIFVLMFLSELFLDSEWLQRKLGRTKGPAGWGMSVAAGVLSMGPMYAWYPLLGELGNKGVSPALIATFLYSRAVKIPLLPLMAEVFGLSYTIILVLSIVVFSVVNGAVTARLATPDDVRTNSRT